jgi:hypothetical protein
MSNSKRETPSEKAINFSLPARELLFAAPFLGYGFAISYDVGSFSGIELKFFSFFSLSEHLTFALAAFPFALIIALLVMPLRGLYLRIGLRNELKFARFMILVFGSIVSVGIFAGWVISVRHFSELTIAALFLFIGLYGLYFPNILPVERRIFMTTFFVAWSLFGSFVFGLLSHTLSMPTSELVLDLKSGEKIEGNTIRAGDRGVLLGEKNTHNIIFLKWDGISKITLLSHD